MTIKALIFDVDGTLAETEEAHRAAFNQAFKAAGLDWNWSVADYRQLLKTTGGKERIKLFQADFPADEQLTDEEIKDLHAEKTKRYLKILKQRKLALRPGVKALVQAATDAGIRVAIATTTSRPNVDTLCVCFWGKPAGKVFEVIACGDEVENKKPAPDVYLLALERLGLSAKDCVAFEDSRNGLISAHGADLPVVITPSMYTDTDDFTGAECMLRNLTDPDLRKAKNLPFEYPFK